MVLGWVAAGQHGETPHVPAEGYKWNQLPALNEEIRQKHLRRSLDEVQAMFRKSYQKTMETGSQGIAVVGGHSWQFPKNLETIEGLPGETLFTSGLYPWMNKNTLAAYFTSCTSSHYRWALKEIRKGLGAQAYIVNSSKSDKVTVTI